MDILSNQSDLSFLLTETLTRLCQRAYQSLAVVHKGRSGAGAVLIWRQDGSIATNNHVIRGGSPRVSTLDGCENTADVDAHVINEFAGQTLGRDNPTVVI